MLFRSGGEKLAKGPLAQAWEDAVDTRIERMEVSDILDVLKEYTEPWMEKTDPKTKVHDLYAGDELGIDHIVDVLKEDLANGRIRPEQLNKVSMADAVRRTYRPLHRTPRYRLAQRALEMLDSQRP